MSAIERPQTTGAMKILRTLTARRRPLKLKILTKQLDNKTRGPTKKALLVACSYEDGRSLSGPGRDVRKLKKLLIEHYNYRKEDIVILSDCGRKGKVVSNKRMSTRENIINEIRNLVRDAQAGDHLLFHFSGHGGQVDGDPDDPKEPDGQDEAIIPCDGLDDETKWIVDDELNDELVKPLPVGCRLTAIFDCCHSGTALDLDHYACNRVYVPWVKPRRRSSTLTCSSSIASGPNKEGISLGRMQHCERTSVTEVKRRTVDFDVLPETQEGPIRLSTKERTGSMMIECTPITSVPRSAGWQSEKQHGRDLIVARTTACACQSTEATQTALKRCISQIVTSSKTVMSPMQSLRRAGSASSKMISIASRMTPGVSLVGNETKEKQTSKAETSRALPSPCENCQHPKPVNQLQRNISRAVSKRHRMSTQPSIPEDGVLSNISNVVNVWVPLSQPPAPMTRTQKTRSTSITFKEEAILSPATATSPLPLCLSPADSPSGLRARIPSLKAQVFSIAACRDGQQAFESKTGVSMTATMIKILENDPCPTWKDLMTKMSHEMHKESMERLKYFKDRYRAQREQEHRAKENINSTRRTSVSTITPASASLLSSIASSVTSAVSSGTTTTTGTTATTMAVASSTSSSWQEIEDEMMKDVLAHPNDIQQPLLGTRNKINMNLEYFEL